MTVKELIEQLKQYDENLPVYHEDIYYDTCDTISYVICEEESIVVLG